MGAADRMRQLGEEATPEPWKWESDEPLPHPARRLRLEGPIDSGGTILAVTGGARPPEADAQFIVVARKSWESLCEVVDAAETSHGAWLFDDEGERLCICGRVDCDERVAIVELQTQLERGT